MAGTTISVRKWRVSRLPIYGDTHGHAAPGGLAYSHGHGQHARQHGKVVMNGTQPGEAGPVHGLLPSTPERASRTATYHKENGILGHYPHEHYKSYLAEYIHGLAGNGQSQEGARKSRRQGQHDGEGRDEGLIEARKNQIDHYDGKDKRQDYVTHELHHVLVLSHQLRRNSRRGLKRPLQELLEFLGRRSKRAVGRQVRRILLSCAVLSGDLVRDIFFPSFDITAGNHHIFMWGS